VKTGKSVIISYRIWLENEESFTVKVPFRWFQTCLVTMIEVFDGYYILYGDTSFRKNCPQSVLKIGEVFGSVDEVRMPNAIANEVVRCMAELEAEKAQAA
jgi:hypothetical protein